MKYKILLCGKSKAIIDDFFSHLEMEFEAQTTSLRYADFMNHCKYFEPDAVIFCIHKESAEVINNMVAFMNEMERKKVPLIIIGNELECEEFQRATYQMAKLVLTKPIRVSEIGEKIIKFVAQWKEENVSSANLEETKKFLDDMMSELKKYDEKQAVKKHVLVVDDDPMMLKLIKEQLKDTYTVATAISGKLALKFLENKKTDLIILDYEMPEENGAEVLKKIRDNEATSNLPVVFLTGISEREKIQKVLNFKPQGYLLKPIEREKLLQIIENTIG